MSSSTLIPIDSDAGALRPRNRKLASVGNHATSTSTSLLSSGNPSPAGSRGVSPIPAARIGRGGTATTTNGAGGKQGGGGGRGGILDGSWSWAAVQELATSFLVGDTYASEGEAASARGRTKSKRPFLRARGSAADTWGPAPPTTRPGIGDIAAGALADREAELRARRTASVLESHPGVVNGGLDVSGRFKRRTSDEDLRGGRRRSQSQDEPAEDQLVYIHHVQPSDTYAGIVLKYRCREDAFRKANGLWSRDNIQVRKWLAMPVDACEVKGRLSQGPSATSQGIDLLAPTPTPDKSHDGDGAAGDYFSSTTTTSTANWKSTECLPPRQAADGGADEERPWTHVRWVTLDAFAAPVEIARVSRKALGYFPPRRKKSLHTASSTLSTPRQSMDVASLSQSEPGGPVESPGSSSRRTNITSAYGLSTPPSRSRVGSGGDDMRPAWMRRPGGVGSLGKHVRAPGPDRDYLNTWTTKHIPGLNIDSLPSMSVMGSETAHFGFGPAEHPATSIAESPFDDGRDLTAAARFAGGSSSGLDRAAASIETWLRGAFAKKPGTPSLGPSRLHGRLSHDDAALGDLIELEDTNSDDGRLGGSGLLASPYHQPFGSSARSDGDAVVRGRIRPAGVAKGKKAD